MARRGIRQLVDDMSVTSQGIAAFGAFMGMLLIGTIGFHYLEEDWGWIDAFYFSTYTLTTVGYGDLVPTTDASRLCASVYMIVGVTIALAALAVIGSNYITRRESRIIRHYTGAVARSQTGEEPADGEDTGPVDDPVDR